MSDDRSGGFLGAVLGRPDCDAPRLIFTDWLAENDEESRSEFIRAQIAIASQPLICTCDADVGHVCEWCYQHQTLVGRVRELLTPTNFWNWLGRGFDRIFPGAPAVDILHTSGGPYTNVPSVRPACVVGYFDGRECEDARWAASIRRGFLEEVFCAAEAWRDHGKSMVAWQPITKVVLTGKDPLYANGLYRWAMRETPWRLRNRPQPPEAPGQIPPEIFVHLRGNSPGHWHFRDRPTALDGLSSACVRYARCEATKAGLVSELVATAWGPNGDLNEANG